MEKLSFEAFKSQKIDGSQVFGGVAAQTTYKDSGGCSGQDYNQTVGGHDVTSYDDGSSYDWTAKKWTSYVPTGLCP